MLEKIILRKLYRRRIIGNKHTAIENVKSGIPAHIRGEALKETELLIKKGIILTKPTSYGVQISLNPERIDEIIDIIETPNL